MRESKQGGLQLKIYDEEASIIDSIGFTFFVKSDQGCHIVLDKNWVDRQGLRWYRDLKYGKKEFSNLIQFGLSEAFT